MICSLVPGSAMYQPYLLLQSMGVFETERVATCVELAAAVVVTVCTCRLPVEVMVPGQMALCPTLQTGSDRPVAIFKERPLQEALVSHRSVPLSGFAFSTTKKITLRALTVRDAP